MKRTLQIASLAILIMLGTSWRNTASAQVDVDISYQTFYDELTPYGEWVDYPEYGYVWVPSESDGFQPYQTNGHWVWSDEYDWMWVSDYSWGWAPFHYGRWFSDPIYGWMWMPGYEWSPAWVAWRDGGDYYGWAPLRPGFNIGINISIGSYNPPVNYWCFAPRQYISSPRIYDYCLDRGRNVTIINNTTIINNYNRRNNVFVTGPRRADAERYAGRINPVRFRDANRPGNARIRNNEVSVYRPRVQRDNDRQFRPGNFERYDRNRQNNGNAIRRDNNTTGGRGNGNNLPSRSDNDGNRNEQRRNVFDRRNNQQTDRPAQPRTDPSPNDNRNEQRRNVFDRRNNQQTDRPVQPRTNPSPNDNRNEQRRNVFERRSNQQTERPVQPRTNPSPNDNRNEQRRNVFERRSNQQTERPVQPRTNPSPQNEQRRNVFDRGQRQQTPQVERRQPSQPQQPRQFERRSGGDNNRGQGSGNGRGFGRRG